MTPKWAWTGVAICSMWIAVLFTSLFAPSLESTSASGDTTKLPLAAIVVAAVAFIATIVVANVGFKTAERLGRGEQQRVLRRVAYERAVLARLRLLTRVRDASDDPVELVAVGHDDRRVPKRRRTGRCG